MNLRFFRSPPQQAQNTPHRRGSHVGLAALAAVGNFGGGMAIGSSDSFGQQDIFGSCEDDAKSYAENNRKRSDSQDVLIGCVTELTTSADKKLFIVENEFAAHHDIQREHVDTQNKNWVFFKSSLMFWNKNFKCSVSA